MRTGHFYLLMIFFLGFWSQVSYGKFTPERDKPGQAKPLIYGGTNTTIDQQPWQVYLKATNGSQECGGSIIGPNTVLTAAHCVVGYGSMEVYAGVSNKSNFPNSQIRSVNKITVHPSYTGSSGSTLNGDIAVIEVSLPFNFNSDVQPIRYDGGSSIAGANTVATIAGWGHTGSTYPDQLQKTNVTVVASSSVNQSKYSYTLTNDMIAAGGNSSGTCYRDSGGGLWVTVNGQNFVIGVSSFLPVVNCGNSTDPEIYTRVSSYCTWILQQVLSSTYISGPEPICSSGTYSAATSNLNKSWASSNTGALTIDNNGNATRQNNYDGRVTLTLTGSNDCGSASATTQVWVGKIDLGKVTYDFDQIQANDLNIVSANTTHTVYVGTQAGGVGLLTSPVSWNPNPYIGGPYGSWQYDFILDSGQSLFFDPITASNACGTVSRTIEFWAPYSYRVYPNPAKEKFAVEFSDVEKSSLLPEKLLLYSETSMVPIQSVDMEEVYNRQQFTDQKKVEFNVSKLKRGIYYLHVIPRGKDKQQIIDKIRVQLE